MPASDIPARPSWRAHLAVFAAYLSLAVVLTWPVAAGLTTTVPNDLVDPLLNTWILWWNSGHLPLTAAWWQPPAFYPAPDALTFSEHLTGLGPVAAPVQWLGGSALLTYNVMFLLSFPLSAMTAYLLGLELTGGRRDAAFLGGLVYGFAPYRIAQLAHLQVLASYAMPLALLGLHRHLTRGGTRWLALFGVSWLLQALTNGYYLVYFTLLVVLWVLWFVPWRDWRKAAAIAATGVVAAIPVLFVVIGYRVSHAAYDFHRILSEVRSFSADVSSLLDASYRLTFWSWITVYHRPEGELFPGLGVVVLVLAGLWRARSAWRHLPPAAARARRWLGAIAVLFGAVSISAMVSPWSVTVLGETVSSNRPEKPLTVALVFATAAFALSRPIRQAVRARSTFAFYVLAAALAWVLALGPEPMLGDRQVLYEPPYAWLMRLPGFDSLRVPARFGMIMMLCLSAAGAIGFRWIAGPGWTAQRRRALAAAFAVVIVADTWIGEMPHHPAPPVWDIAPDEISGAVLVLPLGDNEADVRAMYQGIGHGRPVVNGYSGHFPPWYFALQMALESRDPEALDELSRLGVTQIIVSDWYDREDEWHAYALTRATLRREGADGTYRLFDLPAAPPAPDTPEFSTVVPWASISSNTRQDVLPLLSDDDLRSRWDVGPQNGGETITVDLGAPRRVAAVRMLLGSYGADFPRHLIISVSDDGREWTDVWDGPTLMMAFRSAVRNVARTPLTFDLGDRTTRFIRMRQTGRDEIYFWSISEFQVLADRR